MQDNDRSAIIKIGDEEYQLIPVSYTHLDVYKRQSWYCLKQSRYCSRNQLN